MATRKKASPSASQTTSVETAAQVPAQPPAPSPPNPSPSPAPPNGGSALVFLSPPPANAQIPVPPPGSATPGGTHYTAFMPKALELAALPAALSDLKKCTNFAQLFGATALPYAQVLQAFDVGNQWTTMRGQTAAWDSYCRTQEGIAWKTIRVMMDRLRAAFNLAVQGDATVASTMPGLAELLGAKKAIAQKAAATKKANKAAVAKGEAPVHGTVGKKRLKAAQKAALENAKPPAAAPANAPVAPVAPQAPPAASNGAAATSHAP